AWAPTASTTPAGELITIADRAGSADDGYRLKNRPCLTHMELSKELRK
ncbi:hypothetical protein HMPREF9057_02492, partial [Actinomyces sp. oral taxon 171 str. F0337]